MWGIRVEQANKTIMATTQNSFWDVTIPLTKQFWMRQAMFRFRRFRGITYTKAIIARIKSEFGSRVVQVYVTDFGDVTVYTLLHRRESHTLLFLYFMGSGVPEHLHSDNTWDLTKISKWENIMDEECGIYLSQTEPHSQFQNNVKK